MKNKELVVCVDKPVKFKIGYSLGTVYMRGIENYSLSNFGYCPSTETFYFNRNIHLPKSIIKYFENTGKSESLISKMKELGIYSMDDIDQLIQQYNEANVQADIERQKVLNFKRTIENKK